MKLLEGICNQCGLCCCHGASQCEHLVVLPGRVLGQPYSTRCRMWFLKWHKMPFKSFYPDGELCHESECLVLQKALDEGMELTLPKECTLKVVAVDE